MVRGCLALAHRAQLQVSPANKVPQAIRNTKTNISQALGSGNITPTTPTILLAHLAHWTLRADHNRNQSHFIT